MADFRMPSLGADMEVGTILEWKVAPGQTVHKGEIVAVVDTEKSDIDVEVFEDGVVTDIVVPPGIEVPVGTVLAHIAPAEAATANGFVRATPRARREAKAMGVDLAAVAGTGPAGAITAIDLREPPPPADAGGTKRRVPTPVSSRTAIAAVMARSKREIPHYYLATTIELGSALAWMTEVNATRPVAERLLPAALLLKATALAARQVPAMNGTFVDDAFVAASSVHLGVAVSLRGGGLVAPAIEAADALSLDALMAALRDLVQRARAGHLKSSEVAAPTLTVTNLGDTGVDEVYPVIYRPQVAIVGFGRVAERPWASGGLLGVRPTVRATVAADHRVSDGHDGARFLTAIDQFLHQPEAL